MGGNDDLPGIEQVHNGGHCRSHQAWPEDDAEVVDAHFAGLGVRHHLADQEVE